MASLNKNLRKKSEFITYLGVAFVQFVSLWEVTDLILNSGLVHMKVGLIYDLAMMKIDRDNIFFWLFFFFKLLVNSNYTSHVKTYQSICILYIQCQSVQKRTVCLDDGLLCNRQDNLLSVFVSFRRKSLLGLSYNMDSLLVTNKVFELSFTHLGSRNSR